MMKTWPQRYTCMRDHHRSLPKQTLRNCTRPKSFTNYCIYADSYWTPLISPHAMWMFSISDKIIPQMSRSQYCDRKCPTFNKKINFPRSRSLRCNRLCPHLFHKCQGHRKYWKKCLRLFVYSEYFKVVERNKNWFQCQTRVYNVKVTLIHVIFFSIYGSGNRLTDTTYQTYVILYRL